jgi:hypothetical protein
LLTAEKYTKFFLEQTLLATAESRERLCWIKCDRTPIPSKGDRTHPSASAIASHHHQTTTSSGVAGEVVAASKSG